jgi:hypothetical protein
MDFRTITPVDLPTPSMAPSLHAQQMVATKDCHKDTGTHILLMIVMAGPSARHALHLVQRDTMEVQQHTLASLIIGSRASCPYAQHSNAHPESQPKLVLRTIVLARSLLKHAQYPATPGTLEMIKLGRVAPPTYCLVMIRIAWETHALCHR